MSKSAVDHPFYFSPREQRGIALLLIICVLAHIIPVVYGSVVQPKVAEVDTTFFQKLTFETEIEAPQVAVEYFNFDPNTIDLEGWQRLGVHEKSALVILNYLNKGGHFYKPEDLYKIYGMDKKVVDELLPYVKIVPKEKSKRSYQEKFTYPKKETYVQSRKPVNINLADSSAFDALPGIGPVLAKRIIGFRERLGGFYSVEQIGETYGLQDSVFKKLRPLLVLGDVSIAKIDMNTADENRLKVHPYIGYKKAKAIIQYRELHGKFRNWSDVLKIMSITEVDQQRLEAYIHFGE